MNLNENLNKIGKNHKNTINIQISFPNHHQTSVVACSISTVKHFDKFFHPVAQYKNCLICILMNINENLKNSEKSLNKLVVHGGNRT